MDALSMPTVYVLGLVFTNSNPKGEQEPRTARLGKRGCCGCWRTVSDGSESRWKCSVSASFVPPLAQTDISGERYERLRLRASRSLHEVGLPEGSFHLSEYRFSVSTLLSLLRDPSEVAVKLDD